MFPIPPLPASFVRVVRLGFLLSLPVFTLSAQAADPVAAAQPASLLLQNAQVQALGLRSEALTAPSGNAGNKNGANGGLRRFPARVVVPNSQLRFVTTPLPGLVDTLHVAPGMPVRAGQVLARMLSPQVLELRREAIQAESQAGLAAKQLQRDELLFGAGVIAEARLQATQAAAVQAQALASERRKALSLAGAGSGKAAGQDAYLQLRAPIDGVVLEQMSSVGQRLESAAPLYKLGKLSPLQLEIQIPQSLTAGLQPGMHIQVPEAGGKGKLTVIGQAVEAGSQTVLLRASIGNENGRLKPGQMVEVELQAATAASGQQGAVTTIPARALVRHQDRFWVFAQQAGDARQTRYQVLPVRIVQRQGEQVQVEGLQGQERLVLAGVSGLKAIWTGVGRE